MITFKLIRKIGKMLRGGAGKKEIFLGALCGVLIGFNPVAGMTLSLMILITLLLNANVGFALLGVAVGKLASLILSVASFHTGFFIIHKMGLEGLFSKLANAPFVALMDLDVYAMIGSLPFSIIIGIVFGKFLAGTVTKIREQMVKAGEHEKVGKAVGNKFSKFLMWLAFGKQKISTADVLAKESPALRKSGLILVGAVLVIGLLLQFLLLDLAMKKGIQASISARTGAEVNIGKANFSLAGGTLELEGLEVTDPDKPTHNMVQIEKLAADLSMSDLLRRTYTIDLLAGSVLQRDIERAAPGTVFQTSEKDADAPGDGTGEDGTSDAEGGKVIDEYLAKGEQWKEYGQKLNEYLKERKANAEAAAKDEKPKATKDQALADAKKLGYLKARADLVNDRPEWTIRQVEIDQVKLSSDYPVQKFQGSELSSHPELNGQPTTLVMTPQGANEPTAKITLRFDDPAASHQIFANLKNLDLADAVKTGDSLKVEEGKADIKADGSFSTDTLDIPFTLTVRELKTDNSTLNNLKNLEVPGKLYGSLVLPRIKVELGDNLKDAAVDAAKAKAKEEADKAKAEAKKKAEEEMNKALESDEAKELKDKASEGLKKFF